jgi:hypothetical protein
MPRFGKYKIAGDVQTGIGTFPSIPVDISQNNQPSIERSVSAEDSNPSQLGGKTPESQVLTSKEILEILRQNK